MKPTCLLFLFCFVLFETGSLYVALVVLELGTCYVGQSTSNSQRSISLCLLNAGIKGVGHHTWLPDVF